MTRGIYTITNTKNGRVYVGQSSNIQSRWHMHKTQLNNKSHSNYKLLKDWCKYRPKTFSFEVVEEVLEGDINEKEEMWIDSFEGHVYNLVRGDHPTKKVPTLVDGIHEFDSYGSAASWYGTTTWCVSKGARKGQEVDCGYSKHMFQRLEDDRNTLWNHKGFEVYSFEDIGHKMKNRMYYDTDDYRYDPDYDDRYEGDTEELWNQHGFSVADAAEPSYEPEEDYIRNDLVEKVWESAKECLSEQEYSIFCDYNKENLTQESIGEGLGVTQRAVHQKLSKMNAKILKRILNKKWEL